MSTYYTQRQAIRDRVSQILELVLTKRTPRDTAAVEIMNIMDTVAPNQSYMPDPSMPLPSQQLMNSGLFNPDAMHTQYQPYGAHPQFNQYYQQQLKKQEEKENFCQYLICSPLRRATKFLMWVSVGLVVSIMVLAVFVLSWKIVAAFFWWIWTLNIWN